MKKVSTYIFVLLLIFGYTSNVFSQANVSIVDVKDFVIGESLTIKSEVLQEERMLNIYLPSGYSSDSLKNYPVIYLLDGSHDEDFIHIAGIVQFANFPWINMIPESILVGIGNVDRKRDFTFPSKSKLDNEEFPSSGHSSKFIEFLSTELIPLIDHRFRTSSERSLIGQSLGGLLSCEILFEHPELFHNYIIVSPSLWWDDESLLSSHLSALAASKNIYIAVGREGEVMERTANELFKKLRITFPQNSDIYFDFLEDKQHGDALHEAVYRAFSLLPSK